MTNEKTTTIQATEHKTVLFYDDELAAVRAVDGRIFVSVRHICQALGIDIQAQIRRIRRHKVLEKRLMVAKMATTQGERDTYVLRVNMLPLFLTGISTKSLADEEIRNKLERFQDEAAEVLWEAFQEGRLSVPSSFDELLNIDSPAAQAYKMAAAVMQIARQQLLLESQLEDHTSKLTDHSQRLELIEEQLGDPRRRVTPDQAMQISQAVMAVAYALGNRSGRNEYGGVYNELHRRYGINSYKILPASKFEDALNWLNQWLQMLTDDNAAF